MKVPFEQLPQNVMDALSDSVDDVNTYELQMGQTTGHNGVWAAPSLCYDFHESNYELIVINLTSVQTFDAGPAMCTLFVKTDPSAPAWIVINGDGGDTDNQIYECV